VNKLKLKRALYKKTFCNIQHNGWPCPTCFFSISPKLTNKDWQALLLFRGDCEKLDLNNLPKDCEKSLEKIYKLCLI